MKIDFKKINITPTKPILMSGYLGKRVSTDVKDLLYARVLKINDHIIISCDLIGVDYAFVTKLRQQLPHLTIDIFANHTHASFAGTIKTDANLAFMSDVFFDYDETYSNEVISKLVATIITMEAKQAHASYTTYSIASVAANRHDLSLPFDNEAIIFNFKTRDLNIALIKLTLHPTYLKEDNTSLSNDLLKPIEDALLSKYDGILFVQGALGDVSTRFTRKDYTMLELGNKLAEELINTSNPTPITTYSRTTHITHTTDRFNNPLTFESVLYKINNTKYLGLPFEVCSPLNSQLLKEHNTSLLSLCNGYLAYLSPKQYYAQNQYEAKMSLFNIGDAEHLIKEISNEIK